MESVIIREKFINFFKSRGHLILPSSSLVPEDPTLLLTTAGMVQFKPSFLGLVSPPKTRIATVQKCVRTSDIEEVGRTARHLTFFEMLGNFSFGDYYKEEAIRWAQEFLFDDLGLDKERFWATVYKDDDEAFEIWWKKSGFPKEKIVRLGEEDNFWAAGPVGPCGPCSEIIYDRGEEFKCEKENCAPGCDCDRFLEVWNLVFMQFERDEAGNLKSLPRKNIDTGMGLERISMIMQHKNSVFETDLFSPLVQKISEITKKSYGKSDRVDLSIKIIADHSKASTFLIADGVFPSNEGRGYVLRRLIRRVVRHARILGFEEELLHELASVVIEKYSPIYKELVENSGLIREVLLTEEKKFGRTLNQGTGILEEKISTLKAQGNKTLPGEIIFELYDTYGFPPELTAEIAAENGLSVTFKDFEKILEKRREESKRSWLAKEFKYSGELYAGIRSKGISSEFIGYENDEAETRVVAIIRNGVNVDILNEGEEGELIISETPFYFESGGQVADNGSISKPDALFLVEDVQLPFEGMIVHRGTMKKGFIEKGDRVRAKIDIQMRRSTEKNHTATHLLQWALRLILGEHVKQSGSFVCEDYFRFDYPSERPLEVSEIERIETLINKKIQENLPVRKYETTIEHARELGAIAHFGEKYGKFVRVVEIGNISRELCGGTHVNYTSEINLFKIVSDRSVGASMRRIEAVTGKAAFELLNDRYRIVESLSKELKVASESLKAKVIELLNEKEKLEKELQKSRQVSVKKLFKALEKQSERINSTVIISGVTSEMGTSELRNFADIARDRYKSFALVIGSSTGGKPYLVVALSNDLVLKGLKASEIAREASRLFNGGGGGTETLAEAGGKDTRALPHAVDYARESLKKRLIKSS